MKFGLEIRAGLDDTDEIDKNGGISRTREAPRREREFLRRIRKTAARAGRT